MNFEKRENSSKGRPTRAEFERRRAEIARKQKKQQEKNQKIALCAIITLFIASILLFTVAIYELTWGYTFIINGQEIKFDHDDIFKNDIQFVEMCTVCDLCGIEYAFDEDSLNCLINGTSVSFKNSSDVAEANSVLVNMLDCAIIEKDSCFIPLKNALDLIPALSADINDEETELKLNTDKKNVYILASSDIDIQYKTDISAYLEYINTKDESVLLLANKEYPLGKDFEPSDLVDIPKALRKDSEISLSLPAEKALEAMMQDMRADGLDDVYVTSAYRSYSYQSWLFDYYVELEMDSGLSYDAAVKEVLSYSAEPGKSEHQTGLCIDFTTKSIGGVVDNVFETTSAFSWLSKNAWKYGFILRYPKDKASITGYQYEPWHYRFVGLQTAAKIHQSGLCYEEYLEIYN